MFLNVEIVDARIQHQLKEVGQHPLLSSIKTIDDLHTFMEEHVFAVWDFMCLLKALYSKIVCTGTPWFPPKDALSANLLASIIVEEEGDLLEDGTTYFAHFDIYCRAMDSVGADTRKITMFIELLKSGCQIDDAIDIIKLTPATSQFLRTTFSFFTEETHQLAAAFVFGREGLTPTMFQPLINILKKGFPDFDNNKLSPLIHYLERHVELDDQDHFPKALTMLENLVDQNQYKWAEVEQSAIKAINARTNFFDGILEEIQHCQDVKEPDCVMIA